MDCIQLTELLSSCGIYSYAFISFASPHIWLLSSRTFLIYIAVPSGHWSVRLDLQLRNAHSSHLPQSASYTSPLSSDHSSLSIHFVQIGLSSDISSKREKDKVAKTTNPLDSFSRHLLKRFAH